MKNQPDRPVLGRGYLPRFFGGVCAFFAMRGCGGVFSIRRTTSSKAGAGCLRSGMAGV